jgi:hypothetical protein
MDSGLKTQGNPYLRIVENNNTMGWAKGCTMLFLLLFINLRALGQTISMDSDFITWKLAEVRNTLTGETTISSDVFKSSPDSLVWVRDNGKVIDKLHIDSKFETWPDVSADGAVSFNVVWKNIPGTIGFQRNHGEATIVTEFIKNNVNVAPYEFSVSQVIKD